MYEILKLQTPPTEHNRSLNNQYVRNLGYDYKLLTNKEYIYDYSKNSIDTRYNKIRNRDYVRYFNYEKINTFIQLIDYDIQFGFGDSTKGNTLKKYMINLKNNGVKVFTDKHYLEFKNSTKYAENPEGKQNIKSRYNKINSVKILDKENITIEEIEKILTSDIIFNAILLNEISIDTYSSDFSYILSTFKGLNSNIKLNKITEIIIENNNNEEIKNPDINNEDTEIINEEELLYNKLNNILSNGYSIIDCYNLDNKIKNTQEMYKLYINSNEETFLKDIVKNSDKMLSELIKETNNLSKDFEYCYSSLKEILRLMKINTTSKNYIIVLGGTESLLSTFEAFVKNDFLTSDREIKNILNNSYENLKFNMNNIFVDNFLTDYTTSYYNHIKQNNPFTIFLDKAKLFELKELDYRNMEATFKQIPPIINKIDCDKLYVFIYIILCFYIKTNKFYKNNLNEEPKESLDVIADLFKKIKNSKWKHEYSEIEKQFSLMFNFINRRNNPFTKIMEDKEFNQSQQDMIKIRKELNKSREELIEKINEIFYGSEDKMGIYHIFQSIADIAFELAKPMNLYTDLSLGSDGNNLFNEILNACVVSIEMETCMLIYDFIFNFKIPIGKEKYSLNDLNNMIKVINLIITTSDTTTNKTSIITKTKLAKNTSDYQALKKAGFLTYIRDFEFYNEELKNKIDNKIITGYYAEDELKLIDALEYCRRKPIECDMGDYKELRNRILKLNKIEWIAIYANYRLNNEDSLKSIGVLSFLKPGLYLKSIDVGYLNIRNFVEQIQKDIINLDPDIAYIDGYLQELYFDIINDSTEFDTFVEEVKESFYRFYNNIIINERNLIQHIASKISDKKIYDWLMKIMPTYEMLIELFNLKHIGLFNTLDQYLSGMIDKLNVIIKMTFDQFKQEIIAKTETRRYQMLEKEQYYYIQSFPLMIDWIVYNLETFLEQCENGGIEDILNENTIEENQEKIEFIFRNYLIKLKEILKLLSEKQLNDFKKELLNKLLTSNIEEEKIEQLVDSIVDYSKIENVNIELTEEEIKEISKIIEEELLNRFKIYF